MADHRVDPDTHEGADRDPHHHHHVSGLGMYYAVFFALAVGTILTVAASRVDLGMWNTPIALLIATIKAVLVILFFMHVVQSSRLTWVVISGAFLWLFVMFLFTFSDYLTRTLSMY